MAKKKTGIELEFSILDDEFKQSIKEMNSALSSMKKELNLQNEVLKSTSSSIEEYQNKLNTLKERQELSKKKVEETSIAYEKVKKLMGENSTEATKYKNSLNEAKVEQQKIANEIEKTTEELAKHQDALEANEREEKEYNSSLNKLNRTLDEQRSNLEELKKQYINTVLEQGKSSDKAQELKQQIGRLNDEINESESRLDDAEKELKDFSKSEEEAGKHAITFGEMIKANVISDVIMSGLRELGNLAKQAISTVKNLISDAISVGEEFEASMKKVQAISGATGEDYKKLEKKAEEMGAKTKFSASESAEAMQYMAMAGWKTEDMLDGISGIMDLAAASGEELATTSDIVTDALTALGLSAKDSSHFADILAAASSNSNTNVSMMGETFKYAASIAGSLKYSAEDTALAIGLMANAGIKATQAGTSLRSIMSRLATDTNGSRMCLENLGITVINSDGSMRSFGEVLLDIRTKFKDLSEEEQAIIAKTVAGQNALSGFLAIANSSDEDFNKLSNAINNCSGAAEEMSATMLDNLRGSKTLLKSAAEGLGISIYNGLKGPLNNVVKIATESVNNLNSAFQEGGFSGFIEQLGTELTNWLLKINDFLPQIFDSGCLILNKFIEGIINNIPQISNSIVTILVGIVNTILSNLPKILQAGITLIVELAKGIVQALPELVPTIVNVILEMVNVLTNPDNLMAMIEAALVLVSSLAEGIIKAIPILVQALPEIIQNIITFFTENLDKIVDMGIEMIINLAMALVDSIPILIESLPKILIALVNGFAQVFPKISTIGWQIMFKLAAALIEQTPHLLSKIPEIIVSVINKFSSLITGAFDIGKNFVQGIWNGIGDAKDWILNKIKGFKDEVLSSIKSFFGIHSPSTVFRDEIGKNLALGIGEGFTSEMSSVTDLMQDAVPTNFDVGVSTNLLDSFNNQYVADRPSIQDTSIYNPGQVSPIYLTIEHFENNREEDVEDLVDEIGFYHQKNSYGKGTA